MTIQKTTGGNLLKLTAGSVVKECCCGTASTTACSMEASCASSEPSMQVTVFDVDYLDGSGDIDWCGKTWTPQQVRDGLTQCVCPGTYDQNPSAPYPYHRWEINISAYNRLRLLRRVNTGISYGINQLALGVAGYGTFTNSDFMTWSSFGSFTSMNLNFLTGVGQPVLGDYQITVAFFGSQTQGGIEYSWAKGVGWP